MGLQSLNQSDKRPVFLKAEFTKTKQAGVSVLNDKSKDFQRQGGFQYLESVNFLQSNFDKIS